jgi:hypothetical protein
VATLSAATATGKHSLLFTQPAALIIKAASSGTITMSAGYCWLIFPLTRPLKNVPFCPISVSDQNFNPQNTECIPVVKIFVFLELDQN